MKKHINYFSFVNEFATARFVFEETPPEGGAHDSYARQIEEIEKRLDINPDQAAEYALQEAKGDLLAHNGDLDKMQKIWRETLGDLAKRNVDLSGIEEAELQKAEKEIQERDSERNTQTNEGLSRAVERQLNAKEAKVAAEAQAVKDVEEAIAAMKKILEKPANKDYLQKTDGAFLGKLTNAWEAWGKNVIGSWGEKLLAEGSNEKHDFSAMARSLQKYLTQPKKGTLEPNYAAARKLWRGEMSQLIVDKLSQDAKEVSKLKTPEERIKGTKFLSGKLVTLLAAQKVPADKRAAKLNVNAAAGLDRYLKTPKNRQDLADKMENSKKKIDKLTEQGLVDLFPAAKSIEQVSILVGDRMMGIPAGNLWAGLSVDHLVFVPSEAKIYGQMKNGCEGNLVIIRTGFNKQTYTPPAR